MDCLKRRGMLMMFLLIAVKGFPQTDTLSITLENVRYPQPVKFIGIRVEDQDLRMAYMDVMPVRHPNGKTVMLFHGKNFGGYYWENVIERLTMAGYRVIVPDQIGFGKSSKPFINFSFHLLATQNRMLLDSLHIHKVFLLGHSMGGMLATRFALMFPDKVEKLVLEDPLGLEDYRSFVPYVTIEEQYQVELKATRESIKQYYQKSYFPEWKPEYEELVNIAAGVTRSSDFPRYAKVSALTYQMIYEQPVVSEFPDLKVPTVLIIGSNDHTILGKEKLTPESLKKYGNYAVLGKQVASSILGAKVIVLNTSHVPHIENPQEFMDALMKSML